MMTVAELMKKLQEFPDYMLVVLMCTYDCGYGTAGGDITAIEENLNCVELWNDEG